MNTTSGQLASFYPHLAPHATPDPHAIDAALLDSVRQKSGESLVVKQAFFEAHGADVVRAAHIVADCYRNGGRLFTLGNGGSSCDAAHIAVEFSHPVTAGRPALPAQNLAQDMAMITAVGNDVGIDNIYERQVLGLVSNGDCAIGVSTSGNSRNVLRGLEAAKQLGAGTIALTGSDGGEMARAGYVDLCLCVGSDSIHRIQETHVAIYHILWDLVHTLLASDRGPAGGAAARTEAQDGGAA
ncbi:SIS domain-containing protein [Rhodanobacter sp. PCA2]|uniref:D-sedoheptulose-7-phosphate isomerase n=1 Tax=Rhodanobacter sp. PCA2 TaxID=2006117 RepID=UPI0015E72A27|nr:SIS domain-containing protein [Rhodanobacter sp. PCA2]MBA2078379.1 phosphoheptose isomerase [Rhodanobacter sp. PCA2]